MLEVTRGRQSSPKITHLLKKDHSLEKKWIPKDITGSEGLVLRNLLKKLLMIYQEMADNQEIADVKCQSTKWLKIACHVVYQEIADGLAEL